MGPAPGWYPDGRGALRWWDGRAWTEHRAPFQPGPGALPVLPSQAASGGGYAGWWVLGALLVGFVVLVALVVLGSILRTERQILRQSASDAVTRYSTGTPNYWTFSGQNGKPIAAGAPWGRSCVPVVLNVQDDVPDSVYAELVRVVGEARSAGLDVGVETRSHTWHPGELYPAGLQNQDVVFLNVFADTRKGIVRADGKPARDHVGWTSALDPGGGQEHLTMMQVTLHLGTLRNSTLEYRRTVRKFLGWTQGIYESTDPGSALQQLGNHPGAPDAFTATDIAAMLRMSGCRPG